MADPDSNLTHYPQFLNSKSGKKAIKSAKPCLWGLTEGAEGFCQRHQWLLGAQNLHPHFFGSNQKVPDILTVGAMVTTAAQWMEPHLLGIRCDFVCLQCMGHLLGQTSLLRCHRSLSQIDVEAVLRSNVTASLGSGGWGDFERAYPLTVCLGQSRGNARIW